eukprot:CAMPEP_0181170716 /NCGR_PEP_ID=MMETSP1096-20121128/1516_1 /TAXON_ID=156174 ORGANISM="Chrysochromulina ericina, Strain CCMP281" /NCGR_SAMPLE_ID=MMETSP1096 /ASSEMBLY_ACC=CAM_ASM_000453 /LENGTH=84 /DNA_ID=CAMNT_0023258299 /DNA_START=339 /DNA_END=590 /DNA_ORIENTATION=-
MAAWWAALMEDATRAASLSAPRLQTGRPALAYVVLLRFVQALLDDVTNVATAPPQRLEGLRERLLSGLRLIWLLDRLEELLQRR